MKKRIYVDVSTRDVAFQFRMGAGFAGDVNRTHPAEIEPALINTTTPPNAYGQFVLVDTATNSVRRYGASDASDTVLSLPFGATVRPFPIQQQAASNFGAVAFGSATPPTSGVIDVLRAGLIMAQLNAGVTAPTKGGPVFIWCAATSGDHIQGGLETEESSGNTVELDPRYTYNGPADINGIVEISVNV